MPFSVSRIPLRTGQQAFSLTVGTETYRLRFVYADFNEAGWLMDLSTQDEEPLACGLPLRPKSNLLAQYEYLGLAFTLFIENTAAPSEPPTYAGLGTSTMLYMVQST